MPATSLHLIEELLTRGTLSKEAAAELLEKRASLIKEAMQKLAIDLFKMLRRTKPSCVPVVQRAASTASDGAMWSATSAR